MSPPPGRPPKKLPEKPVDMRKSARNIISLLKDYKLKLLITLICAILSTTFSVIGPLIIGDATTLIYDGINKLLNNTGTINLEQLYHLLIIAVILYIVSAVFTYLQSWLLTQISTEISYNLRKQIIDKITSMSMSDLDANKRGDILSRITNDVDSLQTGITSTFIQLMTAIITIVGVVIMMFYLNIWMALATVLLVPLSVIVIRVMTRYSQKYFKEQLNYKGRTNTLIEESFTGHDIIRVFNREEKTLDNFREDSGKWYEYEWKSQFFSSLSGPIMSFLSNLAYIVIAVLGAVLVLEQAITVGNILSFFQYISNLTRPIQQITRVMTLLQTAMAASDRIFEFLANDDEEDLATTKLDEFKDEISFENVNFGYDKNKPIIKDLSFNVKKGDKIAIVGKTGAGKTTIIKLLMRFYDINSGSIKIDGRNIEEYTKNSLRSKMGMVLQDTWLFSDTIMNNIRYGNINATDEEIIDASKHVYTDNFIRQLPEGYDTLLNEDTDNISQGQKQLITIARTILSQKEILILDEATSSVDTRTEKLIQKAMDKLMKNRTSFVIAHRLSTIQNADKILVIEDGQIIEQGTHEELLGIHGVYYNMQKSSN
ncbi:ABC transporter ATP-binding protein [Methanosphaera sp.]